MIAKILASNNSFNAVKYNNENIEKKGGELLTIKNMPFDKNDVKMNAIKDYLKGRSEAVKKNKSRFKNLQFHATISTKRKEHSKEQLKEIGDKWMKKMGYEKQPYIAIFHGDTKNNHIHIVSTRVNLKNGKKIDDHNEGKRAGKFINQICKKEAERKNEMDDRFLKQYLEDYKYDSSMSMKSFLNSMNYKVYMNFDNQDFHIYKNQNETKINKDDLTIDNLIQEKEKKRIQALMFKSMKNSKKKLYAKVNRADGKMYDVKSELMDEIRKKFALEINPVIKNGEIRNYTLVDHKNRCVYNGNSIMNSRSLFEEPIKILGTEDLKKVNSYQVNSPEKKKLLSDFYSIPEHEIKMSYGKTEHLDGLKKIYEDSSSIKDFLDKTNSILVTGDKNEKFIVNENENIIEKASDVFNAREIKKEHSLKNEYNESIAFKPTGILNALQNNTEDPDMNNDTRNKKKKRKKKRGR